MKDRRYVEQAHTERKRDLGKDISRDGHNSYIYKCGVGTGQES
jgi:hypothetical protein